MSDLERWRARLAWVRHFGDVVEALEAAGAPPATDVGAAHLYWGVKREQVLRGVKRASVTLGGYPDAGWHQGLGRRNKSRDVHLWCNGWQRRCLTPEELRAALPEFVRRVKELVAAEVGEARGQGFHPPLTTLLPNS